MDMGDQNEIYDLFPEIAEMDNEDLQEKVVETWITAVNDSSFEQTNDIPWWPPFKEEVGDVKQVDHVRDVTLCALKIAEAIKESRQNITIDMDIVIVGSLLHDISKIYEMDGDGFSEIQEWVPHPHYAVHILADAGFSLHIQNVVLSHSPSCSVEPKTIEGKIVELADLMVSNAVCWEKSNNLMPQVERNTDR